MTKTVTYSKIESVRYSFTMSEILEALVEKYKIDISRRSYNFELDSDEKEDVAIITVKYETKDEAK